MSAEEAQTITQLLKEVAQGNSVASERVYGKLYSELGKLARLHLQSAGTVSLDVTAIIHEAYVRLERRVDRPEFVNRKVFFAYASTVMRNVIIDYVRERQAAKRNGGQRWLTLDTRVAETVFSEDHLLEVDEALIELAKIDPRCQRVVEMRFFGGLTEDEIASVLGISVPRVRRDWRKARGFLFKYLHDEP